MGTGEVAGLKEHKILHRVHALPRSGKIWTHPSRDRFHENDDPKTTQNGSKMIKTNARNLSKSGYPVPEPRGKARAEHVDFSETSPNVTNRREMTRNVFQSAS